jgi:tetratricopeptide (TPR) repeat protein
LTLLDSMQEKYETFFYKWYAYEIKQDYVKALELYNKAKDIKDISLENKAIILNQIWHVYDLMWDFNKANELYTESENLWYELMWTIINRWRSEFRLNNFEKAKEYFEKILSLSDNKFTRSEVYYNLSVIYLASNDYEKVIDYAKLWIESNENYPNNYISLWVAYIKNWWTQIDETPELFNKAIKIYPNSSVAYKWLWVYYYIKDDFDNAIINFEKQYETSWNNIVLMQNEKDSWKQEALYDLARVYALKNDAEKSIYYLNQVLDWKNIAIYTTFIEDIAFTEGPFWLIINDLSFAKNTENIFKLYKK